MEITTKYPQTKTIAGRAETLVIPFVFVLFFSSGFAALLYQVIWQRVLAIFSGADVYSITIIVAAFMAGLGCGSLAGGYIADRLSVGKRIALFALSELAIAAFASASLWLYYDVLYGQPNGLAKSPPVLALVLFLSLLWPTFFMGMSLPLLAKSLTTRIEGAARVVGALYGFNTLGAAIGAFATAWFFIRLFGFEGTVWIGAALNILAAVGAIAVAPYLLRGLRTEEGGLSAEETEDEGRRTEDESLSPQPSALFPVWVWIAIYGVSGFVALSLEIVWFRLLGTMLKSNAFTFGSLLSIFLLGLAAGTFRGIEWAKSTRHAARAFLGLQAGISLYAALSVAALSSVLGNWQALDPLWRYFRNYETFDLEAALGALGQYLAGPYPVSPDIERAALEFLTLYVALPLFLIGPPTLMMGMSFPLLQKVVQRDVAHLGRRVGWLQTANIFGSMLGAVLTGWLFLLVLGTPNTLRMLLLFTGFFLALLVWLLFSRQRSRLLLAGAGALALLVLAAISVPSSATLWAKLHATVPERMIAEEDGSGLAVLKTNMEGMTVVYVNGLGQSSIPFPPHHTSLGLVPALLHPNPKHIAVIGLGSGATLHGAGGREETERIDCIEIIAPQLSTLKALQATRPNGGVEVLLGDKRIRYTFSDGRAVIMLSGEKYDIIEADALRPTSAYSGNLYSHQYFELLKEHLAPGGFAVTWAPSPRTVDTFLGVFPYVAVYNADINMLIGSNDPIKWDVAEMRARASSPFTQQYYGRAGVDLPKHLEYIANANPALLTPDTPRPSRPDLNSDLFPRDEYLVP